MNKLFGAVESAPPDPIFAVMQRARADSDCLVNAAVGVYVDDSGVPPRLKAIESAETFLQNNPPSVSYLPIHGSDGYLRSVDSLLFSDCTSGKRVSVQSLGGTGALRLGAEFGREHLGIEEVLISKPSWANHKRIFSHARLTIKEFEYSHPQTNAIDFEALIHAVKTQRKRSFLLLQVVCHNPSGWDLSDAQWLELAALLAESPHIVPILDLAYLGFSKGIVEDRRALEILSEAGVSYLLAFSCSKSFSLYNERLGALFFSLAEEKGAEAILSQLKLLIRGMYSNPPAHGARLVETLLQDESMKKLWEGEVTVMRERLRSIRERLVEAFDKRGLSPWCQTLLSQAGMFVPLPLTPDDIETLAESHIYLSLSGRMTIAGLSSETLDQVADAVSPLVEKNLSN